MTTQLAGHLAAIDALLATSAAPGRLVRLRTSAEFWDADPAEEAEAAEEFAAELEALEGVLSLRWGEPETLDLTPHLERSVTGAPVGPPLDDLSALAAESRVWAVGERRVATALGRAAPGQPYELVAAVWPADRRPGADGRPAVTPPRTPPRAAARTPRPWWRGSSGR